MKPAPFEYAAPRTLDEAVSLLAEHGEGAKVLAGGQSLVPLMAFRMAAPALLIDLNRIPGLADLRFDGEKLSVGALTRQRDVELAPWIRRRCEMIAEGVAMIGHVAIRNRGTVGGSLAHADPAAEWGALALALDAQLEIVGPKGARVIPASEFFVGYFTTAIQPTEIIRTITLSIPSRGGVGSAFRELARRPGDFAIAGACALLALAADHEVQEARVALIGVKDIPVRSKGAESVLRGRAAADELIIEAANSIDAEIEPLGDVHGSSDFRRHAAKVMVQRALLQARGRAEARLADT